MYKSLSNSLFLHRSLHKKFVRKVSSCRVGLIGVPFSKGQTKIGTEKAPELLRNAGIIKELRNLGHNVKDFGNIEIDNYSEKSEGPIKNLPQFAACTKKLSRMVKEIVSEGRVAFTLGGDHSVSLGSVDGHANGSKKRVSLLWVDAHPDLNTSISSPSGNAHGMPVSMLIKELEESWPDTPGLEWQKPRLLINNVGFIGLRDVDPYERHILSKFNVAAYGMDDIDKYGVAECTARVLSRINPDGDNALHLSFDVDSLDMYEAPCTGTPVRGGLTLREAMQIMEIVRSSGTLSAMDLVEINLSLGNSKEQETTIQAAIHVVKSVFGGCRFDSTPS